MSVLLLCYLAALAHTLWRLLETAVYALAWLWGWSAQYTDRPYG